MYLTPIQTILLIMFSSTLSVFFYKLGKDTSSNTRDLKRLSNSLMSELKRIEEATNNTVNEYISESYKNIINDVNTQLAEVYSHMSSDMEALIDRKLRRKQNENITNSRVS